MPSVARIVGVAEIAERLAERRWPLAWIDEDKPAARARQEASRASGRGGQNVLTLAERTAELRQAPRPESESIVGGGELSSCIASRSPSEHAGFATRSPEASSRSN